MVKIGANNLINPTKWCGHTYISMTIYLVKGLNVWYKKISACARIAKGKTWSRSVSTHRNKIWHCYITQSVQLTNSGLIIDEPDKHKSRIVVIGVVKAFFYAISSSHNYVALSSRKMCLQYFNSTGIGAVGISSLIRKIWLQTDRPDHINLNKTINWKSKLYKINIWIYNSEMAVMLGQRNAFQHKTICSSCT